MTGAALAEPGAGQLAAALDSADPQARERAAVTLAGLRDPAAVPALARIVADRHDPAFARCRPAALQALVALGTEAAAVELALALAAGGPLELHESAALLAVAYAGHAGVAAPRVVRALVALLGHEDGEAAARAASLLMLFPSESHGPLARVLRTGSTPQARRLAAQALGACRQEAAVAALVAAHADPDRGVRAAARASLRRPA